ncbi:MAG: response regulator transcription factor [Eubacteriales bacterium]|nr:response regulator transcription factor [Eubacteriales bacterium]
MIYIIEDDENIRNLVQVALNGSGYETAAFETAEEALGAFKVKAPQLAIFDLMLPGMDGLEAIRRIRAQEQWKKMPILVLTAKDKEYDKVAGLDGGADDYMTKPFSILELQARVRSLLRRTEEKAEQKPKVMEFGTLRIDTAAREVRVGEREVVLTYKEYELLLYLVENRSRVVSRDELLDKLWDWRADVETRTLDIHIKTLRQKLGEEGGRYIKTVRSVGYRFTQPDGGNQ